MAAENKQFNIKGPLQSQEIKYVVKELVAQAEIPTQTQVQQQTKASVCKHKCKH